MTDAKIAEWEAKIDKMSHIDCAILYRFAGPDHPVFDSTLPLNEYFMKRFNGFGGVTPAISKAIGWRR